MSHPLDRVIWSALTTRHAKLAEGNDRARRYPRSMGIFAGTPDDSPESLCALAELLGPGEDCIVWSLEKLAPPTPLEVTLHAPVDQMILGEPTKQLGPTQLLPLSEPDVPDMRALVELTNPGPFLPRSHELGHFIGVREHGQLVAMAGERIALDGFTEVSAVCVHPAHRGKRYAADLVTTLCRAILGRGDTPFLHVLHANEPAISLYRKLGFRLRRPVCYSIWRRP